MMYFRIIGFFILTATALFGPFLAFAVLGALYAIFFVPYDLLVLSVLIDALFGGMGEGYAYQYTTLTALLVLLSVFIQPYLRIRS